MRGIELIGLYLVTLQNTKYQTTACAKQIATLLTCSTAAETKVKPHVRKKSIALGSSLVSTMVVDDMLNLKCVVCIFKLRMHNMYGAHTGL